MLTASAALFAAMGVPPAMAQVEADYANASAERFFSGVRGGKVEDAVRAYFADAKLMQRKTNELTFLSTQISGIMTTYGPMGQCILADKKARSTFVVRHVYHCQHRDFLTRWTLDFVQTSTGWIGINLAFDEKFFEGS
jgi:hypothetical protein